MRRAAPRTNLTRYKTLRIFADREAAAFSAWYELVPALAVGRPARARHLRRRDRPAALRPRPRLRRPLLPADPPDRPHQPQGPQQHADARAGRPRQPLRDRRRRKAATSPSTPSSARSTTSTASSRRRASTGSRSRSTSRSTPRPTIRGSSEHPEWFDWRPDGTIKYAENPPKKYEDIVNFHFYREAIPAIWFAMRDMFLHWCAHGVKLFRVDNPHTKPFPFWEWVIDEVRAKHPDAIFLAEAFTRPEGDEAARQGRLRAVLFLLHLAQRASRRSPTT